MLATFWKKSESGVCPWGGCRLPHTLRFLAENSWQKAQALCTSTLCVVLVYYIISFVHIILIKLLLSCLEELDSQAGCERLTSNPCCMEKSQSADTDGCCLYLPIKPLILDLLSRLPDYLTACVSCPLCPLFSDVLFTVALIISFQNITSLPFSQIQESCTCF